MAMYEYVREWVDTIKGVSRGMVLQELAAPSVLEMNKRVVEVGCKILLRPVEWAAAHILVGLWTRICTALHWAAQRTRSRAKEMRKAIRAVLWYYLRFGLY